MKIVNVTCPHCGAKLQTASNTKMLTCDYCKRDFTVEKEDAGAKIASTQENSGVSSFDIATLMRAFVIIIGLYLVIGSGNLITIIPFSILLLIVICITK